MASVAEFQVAYDRVKEELANIESRVAEAVRQLETHVSAFQAQNPAAAPAVAVVEDAVVKQIHKAADALASVEAPAVVAEAPAVPENKPVVAEPAVTAEVPASDSSK